MCVMIGADLKERAGMNDNESDLFVHRLRTLMTQIGKKYNVQSEYFIFLSLIFSRKTGNITQF